MNLVHRNSFPKLSNFPQYFTQLGKFRGETNDEKHADPGKKNRNSRKSLENSRNLLEAFLRSRKEENLYRHCHMTFKRLYTHKGLLVLVDKASFSKDFLSEFHRRYRPSCHGDIFGALLQISSLPTMCPLRCGALDMCSTARIFRLKHNICMQRISMMLNPGRCGMGYRGRGAWVLRRLGPHTDNARST